MPLTAESNRDAVPMSLEKMDPGGTADVSQSGTAPSMVGPPLLVPPPLRGYQEGRGIPWLRWAAAIAICTAAAGVLLSRVLTPGSAALHVAEAPAPSLPLDTVRILAGVEGGSYVDSFERTWQSDRYFDGGWLPQSPRSQVVQGTRDQELYRRRREGPFRYDIPSLKVFISCGCTSRSPFTAKIISPEEAKQHGFSTSWPTANPFFPVSM